MARTIDEIQQSIIDAKNADSTLAGLNSTSKVAIWLLWTRVYAVIVWGLENLFDIHIKQVNNTIAAQKPHSLQWYQTKAKAFQYGDSLVTDSDVYDPISTDAAVVIINYAAAVELGNQVRVKVATLSGADLAAISGPQLTAFSAYMNRVKDAGVRLLLTSGDPDDLKLEVAVYYDPLILDNAGARLDGTNTTPVLSAIKVFLATLPFNGLFVLNKMIEYIENNVEGVRILQVISAEANYAATPYVAIPVEYVPDAGYMTLNEAYFTANVTYTAHGPIS